MNPKNNSHTFTMNRLCKTMTYLIILYNYQNNQDFFLSFAEPYHGSWNSYIQTMPLLSVSGSNYRNSSKDSLFGQYTNNALTNQTFSQQWVFICVYMWIILSYLGISASYSIMSMYVPWDEGGNFGAQHLMTCNTTLRESPVNYPHHIRNL